MNEKIEYLEYKIRGIEEARFFEQEFIQELMKDKMLLVRENERLRLMLRRMLTLIKKDVISNPNYKRLNMGKVTEWFDFLTSPSPQVNKYVYFKPDKKAKDMRKNLKLTEKPDYIVFTDGSASVKNKKGGCGAYIIRMTTGEEFFISKGFYPTKTGRMELKAFILALQSMMDKTVRVHVYSDSEYVVNAFNKGWLEKWKREDYHGRANVDLLKELVVELNMFEKHGGSVTISHVRGHQSDMNNDIIFGNNVADSLADYKNFINLGGYEKDLKN